MRFGTLVRMADQVVTGAAEDELPDAVEAARSNHDQRCTELPCDLRDDARRHTLDDASLPSDSGIDQRRG